MKILQLVRNLSSNSLCPLVSIYTDHLFASLMAQTPKLLKSVFFQSVRILYLTITNIFQKLPSVQKVKKRLSLKNKLWLIQTYIICEVKHGTKFYLRK